MSRPVNPDAVEAAIRALRSGLNATAAAKAAGVPRRTLYNWRASLPEVAAAFNGTPPPDRPPPTVTDPEIRQAIDEIPADFILKLERLGLATLAELARDPKIADSARASAARSLVTYAERHRELSLKQAAAAELDAAPPPLKLLTPEDAARRLAL